MRKVLFFLGCLLLCLVIFKEERVDSVFSSDTFSYHIYELTFENKELSTRNFKDYFMDYKIIFVQVYLSDIYKHKIPSQIYPFVMHQSIEQNISRLEKKYIDLLEYIGYRKEALKVTMNGLFIKKVTLYCTNENIVILQQSFPNVQWLQKD